MNELTELIEWWRLHLDGEWEHQFGIRIESMDNPGWWVRIDLADRGCAELALDEDRGGGNWVRCTSKPGSAFGDPDPGLRHFEGMGGEANLPEILRVFLQAVK